MIVDRERWALSEQAGRVLASLDSDLSGHCSVETHSAALELSTSPHATVGAAVAELGRLRVRLAHDVRAFGLAAAAAGVHPGELVERAHAPPAGRYQLVHRTMRGIARREPTFALHVHVGVPDGDSAIVLMNRLRAHLPLLLALSASSPLWQGRPTGLASNRTVLFQAFPRTGIPRCFESYADWVRTVDTLIASEAIPEPTFLWWDVRPQPRFGTVEVRIMDAQPRLEATAALCALIQSLARLELETGFASPTLIDAQEVLAENRFLASRDGVEAEFVDPVGRRRVPLAALLAEVLVAAAPHAAALGATTQLADVVKLVSAPEARRQEGIAARAGVGAVVCDLVESYDPGGETTTGEPASSRFTRDR